MVEKRKYKRSPFHLKAEVVPISEALEEEGNPIHCSCRDLSNGRLSFISQVQLCKGDIVRTKIILPETRVYKGKETSIDSVSIVAKVMYSNILDKEKNVLTGIKFLNIYKQDYDMLCSYIVDTMSDSKQFSATSTPLCLSKKSSVIQIK